MDPSSTEREFGRILEESLNEIFIFDAVTLQFLQVNRGGRENLGMTIQELRELTPVDIKPHMTRESFEALIQPLRNGSQETLVFDTLHRRKNGSDYEVEVHLQLASFHDLPAFVATILDTTKRNQVANDLRVRNRAIESVGVGVVISDASQHDMPIIYCNHAFERITGYGTQEVIGRNCRFLQQDDRDQEARHTIRETLHSGEECRVLLRNYRKDGQLFWNDLLISPVKNSAGVVTHYVGLCNDLTQRIRAEVEKSDRETRLQAILNTAVEAIITIDEWGVCESLNPAAETMFGYSVKEVIGQNISMLMPSPYREEHDQYLQNYLRTGEKKIIGIGREVVGRRKSGEEFPMELSVSEVRLKETRLFTGMVRDVTELKHAQQQLIQAERLTALGEATARLAHESRNSLQRIQIAVETARLHCDEHQLLVDQLNSIENASDRLHALHEEVRNYAAPLNLEFEETTLAKVWRSAWSATQHLRQGRQVHLIEQIPTDQIYCRVDRFRFEQVFRNLFENALVACSDPVEIAISVTETHTPLGDKWRLSIQDNGVGLDEQQRRRVFEPFFTTKAKGTGLGMAIAQRIVEAHGGTISVGSGFLGSGQRNGAEFIIEISR
ncbi:PAS domain S-box protein [Adhaeretor mobilis]|uniref:Sensor protein FixL n=1 Tax=Adhaeretor mobilis TaxID=1930276 RepID=A0A517MZD7_9BACT|nr:PAS domain S-box protein [Adhaeretor mobilis]QDT00251.1 Sensor protein FixL [Adhaeretor mobilis]